MDRTLEEAFELALKETSATNTANAILAIPIGEVVGIQGRVDNRSLITIELKGTAAFGYQIGEKVKVISITEYVDDSDVDIDD